MNSRKSRHVFPWLLLGLLVLGGCAGYQTREASAPVKYEGGVMVNTAGMTLYTFDRDAAGGGKSVCNGPCAQNWPPLAATPSDTGSGDFSVITRDDGSRQWAYKGKPLHLWSKDQKPGDKTGDGFINAWHVVRQPVRMESTPPMRSGY